jgi:hypothetical protein
MFIVDAGPFREDQHTITVRIIDMLLDSERELKVRQRD